MQTVSYMGNGQTTEFYFDFPYYENTNIVVTKNNKPATGYYVVGNSGGVDANIPFTGGKVVFEHAPISTDNITISRSLPLSRIVDYQPTAKLNPTVLNQDLNYIMEILKDYHDTLGIFRAQYADITNNENTDVLLQKMNATTQAIETLGDISSIHSNITTLNARTNNLSDYVVASQLPNASNSFTWYRKYKSGFVEFGGRFSVPKISASSVISVTIDTPIPMVVVNVNTDPMTDGGNSWNMRCCTINTGSTTQITLGFLTTTELNNSSLWMYTAYGMAQ